MVTITLYSRKTMVLIKILKNYFRTQSVWFYTTKCTGVNLVVLCKYQKVFSTVVFTAVKRI